MTGSVRDYFIYIFSFLIISVGGTIWFLNGISFDPSGNAPINLFEIILVVGMISAALGVVMTKSRLNAILAVGALGYFVTLFFIVFRAPDLALTQFVVETVTTALYLLCFYHLPEIKKEVNRVRFRAVNLIISLGVGTLVTILALSAQGNRLFEPISTFYEKSYELAGANNIVNAILVDFRGMDTMVEILVLTIAGLGVYTLIKLRIIRRNSE